MMDSKELKNFLKSAREAIRIKDFKEALKHCKMVLKEDKDNYNALVFVGVAADGLCQMDQAIAAYKKAISVDANQPLAWQGLATLYEKISSAESQNELQIIYPKLIALFSNDDKKKTELHYKLLALLKEQGKWIESFKVLDEIVSRSKDELSVDVAKTILQLCTENVVLQLTPSQCQLMESAAQLLINSSLSKEDLDLTLRGYFKLLPHTSVSVENLHLKCLHVLQHFPSHEAANEIICYLSVGTAVVSEADRIDADSSATRLSEMAPDSGALKFIKACEAYSQRAYAIAKEYTLQGLQVNSQFIFGWLLLADVYGKLHDSIAAMKCIQKVSELLVSAVPTFGFAKNTILSCQYLYEARGFLETKDNENWTKAIDLCRQVPWKLQSTIITLEALLKLENYESMEKILQEENVASDTGIQCLQGQLYLAKGDVTAAKTIFEAVLAADSSNTKALHGLAIIHWKQTTDSDLQTCYQYLLQCVKSDPFFSQGFLYLGYYYNKTGDVSRAEKCFRKCYQLDPLCEEAGTALADILNATDQQASVLELLLSVTSRSAPGTCKWAWLRLGLHQLKHSDHKSAIISLQSALRADTNDYHCWECLGEAYLQRGSFIAALKAFTKVTELTTAPLYSLYQIGTIKLCLGQYAEAMSDYKVLLEKSQDYVPALKGLGEACYLQAKNAILQFLHKRATDLIEDALKYLSRAVYQRPTFSCLWKLLGDCCSLVHYVPNDMGRINVPIVLVQKGQGHTDEASSVDKTMVLAIGARCYGMAIKCQPQRASLWHDLGVNYYHQAVSAGTTNLANCKYLMSKAFQSLEHAVHLEPGDHHHWSTLGIVAAHELIDNKAFAQHCFIKSIQTNSNNVVAWSCLGTLYLQSGRIRQAHEAWKTAQSLDPSNVTAWIGQALIAETVGQEDEAIDLFRHTTELCCKPEGALGYASWVCRILLDPGKRSTEWNKYIIDHMDAVGSAAEVMVKYIDRFPDDPTAQNICGLLLERQGLYQSACRSYAQAVRLLANKSEAEAELRQARINLYRAYSFCSASTTSPAPEEIKTLTKDAIAENFNETCSLGLSKFHLDDYSSSYQLYRGAYQLARNTGDQSHVCAALGMVKYTSDIRSRTTPDIDDVKTELFRCLDNKPVSPYGLTALLAIGILHHDVTLASAVLEELKNSPQPEQAHHHTFLIACTRALQGDIALGKKELCRLVHCHPNITGTWTYLVNYLLLHDDLVSAMRCAIIGLCLKPTTDVQELVSWLPLALLGCGYHSSMERFTNAHSAAQNAVHLYPDNLENWLTLTATLYAEIVLTGSTEKVSTLMTIVPNLMAKVETLLSQKEGNLSRLQAIHSWCVKLYVLVLLMQRKTPQALQFLNQALWLYEDDNSLKALLAFVERNEKCLGELADDNSLARQALVHVLREKGKQNKLIGTLESWISQERNDFKKCGLQVQLAFTCFTDLMSNSPDTWLYNEVKFNEAIEGVLGAHSMNPVAHLLCAIVALKKEEFKSAKRSLQTSLKHAKGKLKQKAQRLLIDTLKQLNDTDGLEALSKETRQL